MSDQQTPPQAAAPQYSPDGRWWWDGRQWVPVAATPRRGGVVRPLLLALAAVAALVVVGMVALFALVQPVGTQHDTDELGGDYCKLFPEDC